MEKVLIVAGDNSKGAEFFRKCVFGRDPEKTKLVGTIQEAEETANKEGNIDKIIVFEGMEKDAESLVSKLPKVKILLWGGLVPIGLDGKPIPSGKRVPFCGFQETFYEIKPRN